jgi:hypothetical protein
MQFAESGYYIEKYIKCDNCGVLIYRDALTSNEDSQSELVFCTQWCIDWYAQKTAGKDVPLVAGDFNR